MKIHSYFTSGGKDLIKLDKSRSRSKEILL